MNQKKSPNPPGNLGSADITERLLASLAGLPQVCTIRACRRRKRCLGPDAVCLLHHTDRLAHYIESQQMAITSAQTEPASRPPPLK